MVVSAVHSNPVMVNGHLCHNCSEVSRAKRGGFPDQAEDGAAKATSAAGANSSIRQPENRFAEEARDPAILQQAQQQVMAAQRAYDAGNGTPTAGNFVNITG